MSSWYDPYPALLIVTLYAISCHNSLYHTEVSLYSPVLFSSRDPALIGSCLAAFLFFLSVPAHDHVAHGRNLPCILLPEVSHYIIMRHMINHCHAGFSFRKHGNIFTFSIISPY